MRAEYVDKSYGRKDGDILIAEESHSLDGGVFLAIRDENYSNKHVHLTRKQLKKLSKQLKQLIKDGCECD